MTAASVATVGQSFERQKAQKARSATCSERRQTSPTAAKQHERGQIDTAGRATSAPAMGISAGRDRSQKQRRCGRRNEYLFHW
jgi:hypothetical protein